MPDCAYCNEPSTRHEPFGDEACCDHCFNILFVEAEDAPWRCGCDGRGA